MSTLYGAAALPANVAKDYEVVGWVGGHRQDFGKFGVVDLSNLTPEDAAALVKKGFKKLRLKTTPKAEEPKAAAEKKS